MKKHDEGYALVLVLVVVLVLNIAAVGLMTLTLNNLKTQRNLVDRMVDKYAAQGEIEIAVATLDADLKAISGNKIEVQASDVVFDVDDMEKAYCKAAVTNWLKEQLAVENDVSVNNGTFSYAIPLIGHSEGKEATITCELTITGTVEETEPDSHIFEVKYLGYQYTSYEYSFQETSPSETTEGGATE